MVIQEYYHLNILDAWKKYEKYQSEKEIVSVAYQVSR